MNIKEMQENYPSKLKENYPTGKVVVTNSMVTKAPVGEGWKKGADVTLKEARDAAEASFIMGYSELCKVINSLIVSDSKSGRFGTNFSLNNMSRIDSLVNIHDDNPHHRLVSRLTSTYEGFKIKIVTSDENPYGHLYINW